MNLVRYTLLGDGTSDRALMPIIDWSLQQLLPECALESQWADLRRMPNPPIGLVARIRGSIELFPCDVLFVHRDAEGEPARKRVEEVSNAVTAAGEYVQRPAVVAVVPVRMQEAWLLTDVLAIRRAAGNPNGTEPITLPPLPKLESLPDPKQTLHQILIACSGLKGRRRRSFRPYQAAILVSQRMNDFSVLRTLLSGQ